MAKNKDFQMMIAGLGGQGALFIGKLLTEAALTKFKNASFLPNYGSQMRLGPSECTVSATDGVLSSPVTLAPMAAILLDTTGVTQFEPKVASGALLVIDSGLVKKKVERKDVTAAYIPATNIATKLGNMSVANLVMLGAYIEGTGVLPLEAIEAALDKRMAGTRREDMLPLNKSALREGAKAMAAISRKTTASKKGAK